MKVKDIKSKVAAKVAKGKSKVAAKCGKLTSVKTTIALFAIFSLFVNSGCQHPAQRAQTAETTQKFYIYEGATANFTFGSEFVSLAQSNETGGNDAGLVATQTTDTKPEIAVGVGGSSAGVGQSAGTAQSGRFAKIGAAADAVASLVAPGVGGTGDAAAQAEQPKSDANAANDCPDGNCAKPDCPNCKP